MPTPIKYFSKDPNNLGRGAGVYYHRGHNYFSKYSRTRDAHRLSKGWRTDPVGVPRATRFPHIGDGNIIRYPNKKR